uniref:Uncharacterized protein n=1 Tax=Setaria italica TaxID=4555 RepID=K3XTX7_SETIT
MMLDNHPTTWSGFIKENILHDNYSSLIFMFI